MPVVLGPQFVRLGPGSAWRAAEGSLQPRDHQERPRHIQVSPRAGAGCSDTMGQDVRMGENLSAISCGHLANTLTQTQVRLADGSPLCELPPRDPELPPQIRARDPEFLLVRTPC